jgi:phosphatidate cytidylyltransferase
MKTNEIKNEQNLEVKNDKSQKSGFVVRLISTVFLLMALVAYCGTGIIYQEVAKIKNENWVDTFAYLSLILSGIIVAYATYEIVHVFKALNHWAIILGFILLNVAFYLFPTTSTSYDFGFYDQYNYDQSFWKWIVVGIILCYFVLYLLIGILKKGMDVKKGMLLFLGSITIIFALKAFVILMLSGAGNGIYGAGTFSYITPIWLWLIVIFADSFAYLGGWKWGKHKMAPVISPKKTWEGAFVGTVSALAAGILVALLLHFFAPGYEPFHYALTKIGNEGGQIAILVILSCVFPIISALGDLFFSLIKRTLDIKDYSNLVPGHGGALDRLDSFMMVHAVAFILISFVH